MKGSLKKFSVIISLGLSMLHPITSQAYDRIKARDYALEWAYKYNTKEYYKASKDCTNFVSQCMAAGGKKVSSKLPSYTSTNYWRPHSATWENATYWRKYWKDKASKTASGTLGKNGETKDTLHSKLYKILSQGDIIQHGNSSTDMNHSQIVIGKIYDAENKLYTIRMAQHTVNNDYINLYTYIGIAGNYICGYHFK